MIKKSAGSPAQIRRLPIHRPYFASAELEAIAAVPDTRWVSKGAVTEEFEAAIRKIVGTKHVSSTKHRHRRPASGTRSAGVPTRQRSTRSVADLCCPRHHDRCRRSSTCLLRRSGRDVQSRHRRRDGARYGLYSRDHSGALRGALL